MHIILAKLDQARAGDNEVKFMMKHAPEWVRASNSVIRSAARCPWSTVPVLKKPHPFQTCDKSAVTIVRQPKDINTDRKPPIKVIKRSTAARKDVTSRTWRPRGVTVFVLVASHQNSNYSSDGVRQERNPLRLISNSQINLVMHLSDNVNPICSHRRTMVILLPFNSGGQITIDSPKKIFYV